MRVIVSVRENLAKIRRVIVSGSVRIKKSNCEKRVTAISWFSYNRVRVIVSVRENLAKIE